MRIQVHLIDGASGFEIWGQRYDGTLDDVFALQENVAQAITAAIGSALGIAMQTPKIQGMTQSKQAYDLFQQGRSLWTCNGFVPVTYLITLPWLRMRAG